MAIARTPGPRVRWHAPAVDLTVLTPAGLHGVDRLVLDQVRVTAWDRLLFVECGDGWLVEEAWRRMRRGCVLGLSTSQRSVELAVQLRGAPGRVEFGSWGGARFPLGDLSFDGVVCCVPLICFGEPRAVLQEVARVMRPEGHAYLLESERSILGIPLAVPGADLRGLLAEAGLVEVERCQCDDEAGRAVGGSVPMVIHARQRANELSVAP